jgi:hypothetical protein
MEVYVDMCNNVLQLVDKYYEAQPDKWNQKSNILTYLSNKFIDKPVSVF